MSLSLRSVLFAAGFTLFGATAGLTANAVAGAHGNRSMGGPMKLSLIHI